MNSPIVLVRRDFFDRGILSTGDATTFLIADLATAAANRGCRICVVRIWGVVGE
jgi:hypothetical protein